MLPPLTYSSGNPDGEDFGAQAASISSPLSGPLQWMAVDLCERKEHDLYRTRRVVQSSCGPVIRLHGRDYLNFASNDYLGLAADARLARSAARAAKRDGCGAGASALVVGHLPPLRQLERDIARWEGTASALVFSSGWAANLSAITALVGGEDAIFSDELNHASLIDGCRLSRAQTHIYRHGDVNQLEELLRLHGAASRRRLIVTDSVFSMDGDFAPLPALLELAERYDSLLLLDEAHATGVLGDCGTGLLEMHLASTGIHPDRIIKVGTLSKALGSQGGFVCGSRRLIDWLINYARPYIFSTALAPPTAGAARRAIKLVQQEPIRRERLRELSATLREKVNAIGLATGQSECQIVPVVVGESKAAVNVSLRLMEKGLVVPAIRPPSVPEGTARLRISLTAAHSTEMVDRLVDALRTVLG